MRLFTFFIFMCFAGQAHAQLGQIDARELKRLQAEKEKKCQRTLRTISQLMAQQSLKDIIRDTYYIARANGYIAAYNQMGCEADDLLKVLNRAPLLGK